LFDLWYHGFVAGVPRPNRPTVAGLGASETTSEIIRKMSHSNEMFMLIMSDNITLTVALSMIDCS